MASPFYWVSLGPARAEEPQLDRLKQHVTVLASPEFEGRRDQGAAKARDYLISEFRRLKLDPLFGDSFRQEVTGDDSPQVLGVNVGARLAATDPQLGSQWIILGVHFDHLGKYGERIFPGADDNASGVAMMLEVARSLVESPRFAHRGVLFVGFDLEERGPKGEFGLRGSQFFAKHPPIPLEQVGLFVTADMIGRSLGGLCKTDVFVLGSEREPAVRPWIIDAAASQPVRTHLVGSDVLVVDRSDYGPFRTRQIPYLFFTTGESEVYHSIRDVAATIDYDKLTAISRIMERVIRSASTSATLPPWSAEPVYSIAEAASFRIILQLFLDHRQELKLKPLQVGLINQAIQTADGVAARGSMTPAERTSIVRTAQIILTTVF